MPERQAEQDITQNVIELAAGQGRLSADVDGIRKTLEVMAATLQEFLHDQKRVDLLESWQKLLVEEHKYLMAWVKAHNSNEDKRLGAAQLQTQVWRVVAAVLAVLLPLHDHLWRWLQTMCRLIVR